MLFEFLFNDRHHLIDGRFFQFGPSQEVFFIGCQHRFGGVEAHAVELQAGDRLLLCSDGLTEMLCNDAIAEVLRNTLEPSAACQQLLDKANAAGGSDNITIVIVRFDPTDTV